LAALVLEDGRLWGEIAVDFQWQDAEAIFADDGPLWHFETRPRGGSKTTDLAGISLVWLATFAAPGARGYVFAGSRDQAALLLDAASGLVDRTPELNDVIEVQATKLIALRTGATVEIRSADGGHAFGLRPSFCVVDELAQWEETRRARKLWTAIVSSLAKVPGCRFICLTSAGEPGHWSHKVLQDAKRIPDRWHVHEVPGPLPWVTEADLLAQGLRDSEYARLHLNQWTQSEDRLVSAADLEAAAVLDGEQEPRAGISYLVSVDLGLVNDKTVVAVGHAEETSPEPGAPRRVVIDSLRRWRGKRGRPVQIEEVESYLALTAKRYSNARILADPWQAAGMIQRLQAQGVRCEQFPFTSTSTGRIGQALHLALRNRLLSLPADEELLSELGRVRLRETGIGQARLDHDSGDHDDQAVAIAIIVAELIGNARSPGGAEWLMSLAPPCTNMECRTPNVRGSLVCRICQTPIEPTAEPAPYVPEPIAAQLWSPWSPVGESVQAPPGQAQTLQFLKQYEHQNDLSNWFQRRS
jgi:phage terminase large subunit-like protein